MEVIRLAPGIEEPEGEDYVKIDVHPDGRGYIFSGTVLLAGEGPSAVFHTGTTGDGGPYPTEATAEAAAIEWAGSHGAETVYVLPLTSD